MTMKKLLAGASAFAVAASLAGIANAQAIESEELSVLGRVLEGIADDIGAAEFGRFIDGALVPGLESVLANIASTTATIVTTGDDDLALVLGGEVVEVGEDLALVLGRIDGSVVVDFLGSEILLSAAQNVNGDIADTYQVMEGTLGDIDTTAIGTVLTVANESFAGLTSIEVGAAQTINEALAGDAFAGSAETAAQAVLAMNAALNTVDVDASVRLSVEDFALAAGDIGTTAIGAVGGGQIVSGAIDRLNRSVASTVALP